MSAVDVLPILTPEERARLTELEEQVTVGIRAAAMGARAIRAIRDARLYRATHASFEDYALARFGLSRPRVYQLIEFADIAEAAAAHGVDVSNERLARALRVVPASDYAAVLEATRLFTGTDSPRSADVAAFAQAARDMAGQHVAHPQTGEPVPLSSLPTADRAPALVGAVQRHRNDLQTFQGATFSGAAEDRPLDWVGGLQSMGIPGALEFGPQGYRLTTTDTTTGVVREGPWRPNLWDAIRAARQMWEAQEGVDDRGAA